MDPGGPILRKLNYEILNASNNPIKPNKVEIITIEMDIVIKKFRSPKNENIRMVNNIMQRGISKFVHSRRRLSAEPFRKAVKKENGKKNNNN